MHVNCLTWNVRSLNNKVDRILAFASDRDISLLFIQETWLTDANNHTTAVIKSHGFKVHHAHRAEKAGGGVAIIYRPCIALIRVFTTSYESFECVSVKVSLPGRKSLLCMCIYRTGPMGSFISDFDDHLAAIFPKFDKFLICGDINIHFDKESCHATDFLYNLSSYGIDQLVEVPTHKAGHTLDVVCSSHNILNSSRLEVLTDTILHFKSCDHFPIVFTLHNRAMKSDTKKKIQFRKLKSIDKSEFAVHLHEFAENQRLSPATGSFEDRLSEYNEVTNSILDNHAPLLEKWVKEVPTAPWFNSEYQAARAKRRKAEKVWRKSGLSIDRDIYVHLRLHCDELANTKKGEYFKGHFEKYNHSIKGLYKFVDIFIDNEATVTLPPSESMQETVNNFNTYFTEKIDNIRKSLPHTSPQVDNSFQGEKLYDFEPVTMAELDEILKETNIKSCSADPLPAELLKDNLDLLIPELCQLVNLSLSSGSMDGTKSAFITPLLKGASLVSSNLKNYRPVSNLSFVGKLIEKVVLRRLENHLKANDLNIPLQSGYKKNHSTETLLIRVVNDLLIASDEGNATVVMLLDLSAAFDTVDHNKLLSILYREIGICGNALKWFKSYLGGRCQRVKIGDFESEQIIIKFGVPQGSVLGPFLFNIYIRSLYGTVNKRSFNIHGYADDHSIYKSYQSDKELQVLTKDLPDCFAEIDTWMKNHYLQLNPAKTEIIVFGSPLVLSTLQINGVFISPNTCIRLVSSAKSLGFYLNSSLDMTTQIKKLKSICFNKLRKIAKMKQFLTVKQMQQLVQALVFSNLDYCNALYYGTSSSCIKQLQSIQNRACATVLGLKRREPKSEHIMKLHWLKVEERIEFKILLITYKAICGMAPNYISELVKYSPLSGSRTPSLQLSLSKTVFGDRAFVSCSGKLWNNLPSHIKTASSLNSFKSMLKTHLFLKSHPTSDSKTANIPI